MSHPTLDAGASSVLLPCLLTSTAMLAYCLFLSYIYDLCMPSDVWPLWHLCLSLLVSSLTACLYMWDFYPFISLHLFLTCFLWITCLACVVCYDLAYSQLFACMIKWGFELNSSLQVGLHPSCVGRWNIQRPTLDADVTSVLRFCLVTSI